MLELNWIGKNKINLSTNTNKQLKLVENNNSSNKLIKGDNLEVLKLLLNDYKNKIKIIYIDPPYNTKNKFIYKDKINIKNYLLSIGIEEKNIKSLIKNNITKLNHASWLSFMYPRLYIARTLPNIGVKPLSLDIGI